MKRGIILGLGLFLWCLFSFPASADELSDLKAMVKQLMEQNRVLSAKVQELERRLEAYEKKEKSVASVPTPSESTKEKWYERINVDLSVAGVAQDVVDADKEVLRDKDKGYAAVAVDVALSSDISKQDRTFVLLEMGSGKNPESEIASFSGIIDEALSMVPVETDDGDVRISEAWYEHDFLFQGGKARLRFGKIDITTDFDGNAYAVDENTQFISPVFVNNIAVEWPDYAFGSMLWVETKSFDFGLGYADANGEWDDILDYPFLIAQATVRLTPWGRPGNYRIYAWYNGEKHDELKGHGTDQGYGIALSFDQEVFEGVGVFLRYGWQNDDIYEYDQALSFGLSLSGNLWGRKDDTFGLGFGIAFLSSDYEDLLEKREGKDAEDEYHLEIYYKFQINDYLALTPDIQWTDNPAGYDDHDDFWVFTLRGTWSF